MMRRVTGSKGRQGTARGILGLLAALAAAPLCAQGSGGLDPLLADLAGSDPQARLGAAYAACLAGDGDSAKTDAIFTGAGWDRIAEPEMGVVEFTSPDRRQFAMIWDVDGFCMVLDEGTGTDAARIVLNGVVAAAGYQPKPVQQPGGDCPLTELKPGLVAELTSSGNDPVCETPGSSGVRFSWETAE